MSSPKQKPMSSSPHSPSAVNTGGSRYVPPLASFYAPQTRATLGTITSYKENHPSYNYSGGFAPVPASLVAPRVQPVRTVRPQYNWHSVYVTFPKRIQTPKVIKEQVTVMVPKQVTEIQMVQKQIMEPVTTTKIIMAQQTVMENQTIMVPKVIETEPEFRMPYTMMEQKVMVPRQRVVMYEEEQTIQVPATEEVVTQQFIPRPYTSLSAPIQTQFMNSLPTQYTTGQYPVAPYTSGQHPAASYMSVQYPAAPYYPSTTSTQYGTFVTSYPSVQV